MKRLVQNIITPKNGWQKPQLTEIGESCLQILGNFIRTPEEERFEDRLRELFEYRYYIIADGNSLKENS